MRRRSIAAGAVVRGCVVIILAALFPAPACRGATPEEVDKAIGKAKEFLYSRQENGNWENTQTRQPGDKANEVTGGQWGGQTAIATYALLAAGESPQEPRLARAIDFLKQADIVGTYALGMRANVWNLVPQNKDVKLAIKRDYTLLLNGVKPTKLRESSGMYDYVAGSGARFDHSVSQYGVLGMWALAQAGVEVPTSYWQLVEKGWQRDQQKDGGWCYGKAPDETHPVTASMTAAGVASLFITQDYLHSNEGISCSGNVENPFLNRGLNWITKHYDQITKERSHYTLYGIERIGVASGLKYFGTIDWYQDGADYLYKHQSAAGHWGSVPNTCFGLLFLSRGRAPVVFNKLQYEIEAAGEKARVGNWNQRPRDAANLARWIGKQTERYFNWQIVNLKVSVDELHDAPILYIAGDQPLDLSKEAEGKLKQFVEQGGLILGNADCGSAKFADSFRRLGQKLFPAYEFRELPANHVIYTNEQFKGAKHPVSLLGLSNGARELMLLFPQQDPGKYWQTGAYGGHEELHEIAADVFLYAVDKQNLRTKGQTYVVHRDEKIKAERTVKLARIQYAGNWDPEPGGWRRLANILHNQNRIDLQVEAVKLGQGKLGGYKLSHLTGTTAFKLSLPERTELQKFVASGGALVVDSAGGSAEFSAAAEAELAAMFPQESKQLQAALGMSHPLYGSGAGQVKDVAYRTFARKTLTGGLNAPRLRGMTIGGRLAVVYSLEDLSVGLVGQPIDGIYGYDPKTATDLTTRIITYLSPAPATRPAASKAGTKKS